MACEHTEMFRDTPIRIKDYEDMLAHRGDYDCEPYRSDAWVKAHIRDALKMERQGLARAVAWHKRDCLDGGR